MYIGIRIKSNPPIAFRLLFLCCQAIHISSIYNTPHIQSFKVHLPVFEEPCEGAIPVGDELVFARLAAPGLGQLRDYQT